MAQQPFGAGSYEGGPPPPRGGGQDRFASFYQPSPPAGSPPPGTDGSRVGLLVGLGCAALVLVALVGGAVGYLALRTSPSAEEVTPAPEGAPARGGPSWSDEAAAVPVSSADPTWGSRTAPVTLVLFSEFACPYCVKLSTTIAALQQRYGPDQLRVAFKHYPLPMHAQARPAAEAADAVFRLGGATAFWAFHDRAFAAGGQLADSDLERWAQSAGVDLERFRTELRTGGSRDKVDADLGLGKRLAVRGTPCSFVNGILVTGARDAEHFASVIDPELAAAQAALSGGTPPDRLYVERCNLNRSKAPPEAAAPRSEPAEDPATVWRVPVSAADPALGPAGALVTIVEFSDFQCPFCAKVQPTLKRILSEYDGKVRLVWKDNPLAFHKQADGAAQLAREARAQKGETGFWAAHDLLFDKHRELGDVSWPQLAAELGLDAGRAAQAVEQRQHRAVIEQGMTLAAGLDARGTPHFFVNGRRLKGAQPYERFRALVDEELPRAEQLLGRGIAPAELYAALVANGRPPRTTEPAPHPDVP